MNNKNITRLTAAALAALLVSCSGESSTEATATVTPEAAPAPAAAQEPVAAAAASCVDEPGVRYLCGPANAEDLLRIGNGPWLLASGMSGNLTGGGTPGQLHLVNHESKTWSVLFPGANPTLALDSARFPGCPGPLDVSNFSVHGMALHALDDAPNQYELYSTSHGAREAVEIYTLDASAAEPSIKWIGCVPMPATSWTNSVAVLNDGGFVATQFMDPTGAGMAGVTRGEVTGQVFEWHPGGAVQVIAGTELSGPNGIVISDDDRYMYVAAFGTHEIVRFDRAVTPITKEAVSITVAPDNIRWSEDETLYTAGGNVTDACTGPVCGDGWSVIEIEPTTMEARRVGGADAGAALRGVSSALPVGNEIWVGTYGGDRLAILPKP